MVYNIPFDMQKHYGYQREELHYYGAIKFNETAASCNLLHAMLCLSHCVKASITTKKLKQCYQREILLHYGAMKLNETAARGNLLHAMLCLSHCIKASITAKKMNQCHQR